MTIQTTNKMSTIKDKFEGKEAKIGIDKAPNGVFEIKAGKIFQTTSANKAQMGKIFYAGNGAVNEGTFTVKNGYIEKYTAPGPQPVKAVALSLDEKRILKEEWDRSFNANEHSELRKENPAKYSLLFQAKFGKTPNL